VFIITLHESWIAHQFDFMMSATANPAVPTALVGILMAFQAQFSSFDILYNINS
jgi:hypothetical protein